MDFEYPWRFSSRRSAVQSRNGIVATSQPLAAQAGLSMLRRGGNAADAAVATAAALNVVEPHMTGMGGDAFALTHFDGDYEALNASGPAPAAAALDDYREATAETDDDGEPVMPADGGLPVTVPGALSGWHALVERHGALDFADVLEPAVRLAREGFPVSEYVARQWQDTEERLEQFDASAATFLPDGSAPEPGDVFANPDFAETLEQLQDEGIGAFYGGDIGQAVVETVRDHGGTLALSDLDAYSAEWTEPVSTTYEGVEVLEHPPNGQGTVALEAMNVAERFDLAENPTDPDRLHHLVESIKLAFADGYANITDPERYDVPLETMLSKEYAAERAEEVGHRARTYGAKAKKVANTAYMTVVDGDGNAVSLINSVYYPFGSALSTRGFALQNRGHSFSLDPEHANRLDAGKRPYHTIIPAMLRDPETGEFRASWGVMGGSMQPQGHLQVATNLANGLNPQAALDAPRFRWVEENTVALETNRVPDEVVANLRGRGHDVLEEDDYFAEGGHWGGGQIIYRREDGTLVAGSDPRRDGQAVGF
ncbi:gamma-glutamyltransferase [Halocalculus aciditolerans]|uniref:Glutamyltransferase n=1 Tax=Halocalculus aciditolerans TaxID=1383812 RepID=A0A830FM38_9EURY|nr:gamma-glutamyltransferase [Halocalculus aciditolerans]GGL59812.1 glutamyltransferase [Halocalculus aciditolerans]